MIRHTTAVFFGALFLVLASALPASAQSTLWERNDRSGALAPKPSWFGAGTERGIAYGMNGTTPVLYVASRNGGNVIRTINATTGADITDGPTFDLSSVTGGFNAVQDISVTSDGKVVLTNMTTDARTTAFKAYVFEPTGGAPIATHSYLATEVAGTAAVRMGDKVTVTGSWSAGTMMIWTSAAFTSPAPGVVITLSTANQGTSWTSNVITLSAAATGDAVIVANSNVTPVTGGFMINGNGSLARRYNSAGAFQVGQTAGYTSSNTGVKSFMSGSRELIAIYTYRPATMTAGDVTGYVAVWDITNPALPVFVGRTPSMSTATAANAVNGDLTVSVQPDGSYTVYGLATDQGIIAYSMPAAQAPSFLAYWDSNGLPNSVVPSPLAPTFTASNLTSGGLVRGSGLTGTALTNAFASSGWTGVSPAGAQAAGQFYEFSVGTQPGFRYSVDGFGFIFRRSSTGPNKLQVMYSLNGGSFVALNDSISYTGTEDGFPFGPIPTSAMTELKNLDHEDNLVIRILGWGASAAGGTGAIGRQAGPDIQLLGATEINPNYVPPANFAATLSGLQENPPVFSMGTGSMNAVLEGDTLRVSGSFSGLTGNYTMSHIHTGANGTNGGVAFALTPVVGEDLKSGSFSATSNKFFLTATQKDALSAGLWYVNIHSSTNGSGEIRGQLLSDPNAAPSVSQITAPANESALTLSGLRNTPFTATWSASTDTDANALTYLWQLSTSSDFSTLLVNAKVTEPAFRSTFGGVDQILANAGVSAGASATVYHRVIATDGSSLSIGSAFSVTLTRGTLVDMLPMADARALPLGSTVTVEGVVTRVKGNFLYFQDATAGLTIRQTAGALFDAMTAGTIVPGTRLKVTGKTSEFRQLRQINQPSSTVNDLESFEVMGTSPIPAAQVVTLSELQSNGEAYEAELVRVLNATVQVGTDEVFAAAKNYPISDASTPTGTTVVLRTPNAGDSDVDGQPTSTTPYHVETVVGQFHSTDPAAGYQLLAIGANDLTPVPQPLAGSYQIPTTDPELGFADLSDAVAYLNQYGASGPVIFSITESFVDTVAAIRIDRQDLTGETPLIITAAEGATPTVRLRQLHNFATDHVYILGSLTDLDTFRSDLFTKALRKGVPSKEEGMKGFEDFDVLESAWGPRNLTFVAGNTLGATPFFLWEGSVTNNFLSGIKLTMTGTVAAGAPGIRINRRDAVGSGQGGADNVVFANIQIGAPEDAGKFQTAINVWGSSTGAFPARNVTIMGSEIHANHRGISTQVFADALFMYNEISIYGNAGQATHAAIEINTPVGELTIWGNEIKKLQSVRTTATTMIGIQLTNSLNENGVYIINNMIATNFSNTNAGVTNHNVYGIAHTGSGTVAEFNLYHNTIEVNATGQTTGVSAALAQTTGSSSSAFYAYNNMFVNRSTGGIAVSWAGANLLSDWNNYVGSVLKRVGTTDITTIEALRTSGRDANSVSVDVTFASATDLRLAGSSIGDARLAGETETFIMVDIDDTPRSVLAPYMGAYEGTPLPVIASRFELLSPDAGATVSLMEGSSDLVSITWDMSYSTEAWGTLGFDFLSDAFAHVGNGQSGQGKYVGSPLGAEALLTSPVLQNIGDLSFYVATYNNSTVLTVDVELTTDGQTWSVVDSYDAISGGTGEINFDWQLKTLSINEPAAMVRFRVKGAPTVDGAVYFDDFKMTSFSNPEMSSDVQTFESWTAFKTLRYTWHLDTPTGDFSAPVLSLLSDDDGQSASLTLTHAELDAAIASLNKGWGETYTGRWTVTAQVGETTVFASEPRALSIRRIVNTSVEEREVPLAFALEQNYPNPFNPSTSIRFSLPETANVTLSVYTITGQLVATLVNEVRPAGVYDVAFDASSLSSGVYIYRIHAGGFTDTQKMTLIK